jgi:hypothetical protein
VSARRTAWFVGLVLVIAACGGNNPAEQFLESQDGIDNVNIGDDGSFTITDDEGNTLSVSGDEQSLTITGDDGETLGVFGGGEIPGDFPIPAPPGSNVQSVIETPPATLVILEYALADYSYDELVAFYDAFSNEPGVAVIGRSASETPPKVATWFLETDAAQFNIAVTDAIDGNLLVQLSANLTD